MLSEAKRTGISALTLEVIDAHVTYAVREMRSTMIRMAYSPIVTDTHDLACAITNAKGEIVAMNDDLPMHMFDIRFAVATALRKYSGDLREGDQFLVNDPWECGSHLNDVSLIMPYFRERKLFMWLACTVHWGDVGGPVPGSVNGAATDVFQEGVRFPLTRVTPELLEILLANFRQPFEIEGVFSAQSTCMKLATKRLDETCNHFGNEVMELAVETLLENEADRTRSRISQLRDGVYYFEDYMENGGVLQPEPVRVSCTMTITGDHMTFDFDGTSPQNPGVGNCTISDTHSGVFESVDTFLSPGRVSNSGASRAWMITAPEGCAVNSKFPAPNGAYANVMFGAIHGCVIGCLAQVMPDEMPGFTPGSSNNMNVAGPWDDDREGDAYWLLYEYPPGGWGATKDNDGSLMCWQWYLGDVPCLMPAERIEALNPIRVHFNELYADSGGPGRKRGGLGVRRAFEVLMPGEFTILGSDAILPRPGIAGGFSGALNWVGIIRGGRPLKTAELPLKTGGFKVVPGDIVLYLIAGGGGWGDPLERPAEEVLVDYHDGYVSLGGAREDYGVLIREGLVDARATKELRRSLREARQDVSVLESDTDEFIGIVGSMRVARMSPGFAQRLGVNDNALVEYVNPLGGHVRAWVRIDDSLKGDESPLGPNVRRILGASAGSRVHVREPFTFAMRNQATDLVAVPPLGGLFTHALTERSSDVYAHSVPADTAVAIGGGIGA
jgi:N-methylhydantoinase B